MFQSYFLKVGFLQYFSRNAIRIEQEGKIDEKQRE